jgi:hypothetical protein
VNNDNALLSQMNELVTANTKTMSLLGARTMVMGAFFDAALPHLSAAQRIEVSQSFRPAIEDAMSQMDDLPLPGDYHSTLLQLTNAILGSLDRREQSEP